mmetsp:Transcript_70616/g.117262  ORF Transcript_70616/g.117262 Transcript_70616/m.117262 type:complete len:331 (-) Transcript_70616:407-1399(-)
MGAAQPNMTHFCQSSEVNKGSWLHRKDYARWHYNSPPCCSWDSAEYTDPNYCETSTEGVQAAVRAAFEMGPLIFRATPRKLALVGSNACSCSASRDPLLSMEWVPSECALRDWDAAAFCRSLRGRRILFVGDSIMHEIASVVMNSVAWDEARNRSTRRCSRQIIFGMSDTLVARKMGAQNRGEHWLTWVGAVQPDIVVLSASAHIYGYGNYTAVIDEVVREANLRSHLKLIWVTSPPGGCGARPLVQLPGGSGLPFQWGEFIARDTYSRAYFSRRSLASKFKLLDLEPLHYRVDAHVSSEDCLHLCIPGPLEIVPRLLLQVMIEANQEWT